MFRLVLLALSLFAALGLSGCGTINKMVYPRHLIQPSYSTDHPNLISLETTDGVALAALWLPAPNPKATILYSHGNAEDIGHAKPYLERIRSQGFNVLAYDYRGYGLSEGKPSERGTYRDIRAAYRYLTKNRKIPANNIIVYGRSLGSGPSTDLASRSPIGALVLESGFSSIGKVATSLPLGIADRYRNDRKLNKVNRPVVIIHGTRDRVIPPKHAQQLYKAANEPKKLIWVPGVGHNDMHVAQRPQIHQALADLAKTLLP